MKTKYYSTEDICEIAVLELIDIVFYTTNPRINRIRLRSYYNKLCVELVSLQ